MSTWPTELQQIPNQSGYSRKKRNTVIRSAMDYGPAKERPRVTNALYDVTIQIWCTFDQLAILNAFYDANEIATFDWNDFGVSPPTPAVYRFKDVIDPSLLGGQMWSVNMTLEMEK